MTDEKKPLSIQFAPGCFDSFEGTQEELDEMIKEIETMFATMTPEEIQARSVPVDDEYLEEMDEAEAEFLMRALGITDPRKLQ
jgi:hypothetical protein